jgi:nucleoid-associated protein YgaU
MVSRKQKLIAAGAVLGVGLALALLFRRDEPAPMATIAATMTTQAASALVTPTPLPVPVTAFDGQLSPLSPTPAVNAGLTLDHVPAPAAIEPPLPPEFDVASPGRPVYASMADEPGASAAANSPFRAHVVHNGDTLERLAERYLADGARAVELFDLNRDVLENPHLLPIGAELRIPTSDSARRD